MKKLAYITMRIFIITMVILFSLAVYRSTMQPDYHWGLLVIEGTGTSGHYINIIFLFIWAWLSFLLINWYRRTWYYFLPIILAGVCFYYTLKTYFIDQDDLTFNGDALNIHINMGFIMVLVTLLALIATLYWSYHSFKGFKAITIRKLSKSAKILISIGAALTPIILFEFSYGDGRNHIVADQIAVILTICQVLLFFFITEKYIIK